MDMDELGAMLENYPLCIRTSGSSSLKVNLLIHLGFLVFVCSA